MEKSLLYVKQVNSTNDELNRLLRTSDLPEGFCVHVEFQTSGRGQQGNVWESERAKNLLFSLLLYPEHIAIQEHFLISQMVSVGIKKVLDKYVGDITIKWPNDIYWKDRKIAGILIENSLQGENIKNSVIGIGLNVNQMVFKGDFNSVSLKQITGKSYTRKQILQEIVRNILDIYTHSDLKGVRSDYMKALYRNDGYYSYADGESTFEAKILSVEPDGKLLLKDRQGHKKEYYFKEVKFY